MKKRDPQLVRDAIESDLDRIQGKATRRGLGCNQYLCRVLYRHKCRECPRFGCSKRTERWKLDK